MGVLKCIMQNPELEEKIVDSCNERRSRCMLKLDGMNEYIILKGERLCSDQKICDCFVFIEEVGLEIVALVELKSRSVHASEIEEKLENSLKWAIDILDDCGVGVSDVKIGLIVLAKNWRTVEHKKTRALVIKIRGMKEGIITGKCGDSIEKLISRRLC